MAAENQSASAPDSTFAGVGPFGAEAAHLANIRQLTLEGQNAEAYWSQDDRQIIFQATPDSLQCDQIFTMRADGSEKRMVSTGEGVTTCSYFFYPGGERILYSSTHLVDPRCPARPTYEKDYVWPIHPGYDVFTARPDGGDLRRLTTTAGYDAEATFSRDGSRIVFTSVRDGDLEPYTMDARGGAVKRLTHEAGYDGGAFFSYDGSKISSPPTCATRRGVTSISTRSGWTERDSSGSRSIRTSTPSPCSTPTGRSSCGHRTGTSGARGRRTSSSPTGGEAEGEPAVLHVLNRERPRWRLAETR